jgi:hypothetical protein
MRRWLRSHLTYANVMVTILAFLVLTGGTAVALSGSNTVFTDDIANDTQPAAGGNPAGGLVAADLRPNSVGSSEVTNGSIAGADIAASALPKGRKITSSCNPSSTTFADCGTLTINLPRPGLRVLIVASATWYSNGFASPGVNAVTDGICRIGVNGAPFGPNANPGEIQDVTDGGATNSVTLTNVTDPNLGAGNHTIGLACNDGTGDIVYPATYVSAVVLGPG